MDKNTIFSNWMRTTRRGDDPNTSRESSRLAGAKQLVANYLLLMVLAWRGLSPALAQPSAPANLHIYCGASQCVLFWNLSPTATGYVVRRANASGGPYSSIGSASGNTFTDNSVTNDTLYYYVVTAVSNGLASAASAEAQAFPLQDGGYYQFINQLSGLALDASTGLAVQQPVRGAGQVWQLQRSSGYFFGILNAAGALTGGSPNSQLTTSGYGASANQAWYLRATNGAVVVNNLNNFQVMDDFGASTNAGTPVGTWPFNGGLNQEWKLQRVLPPLLSAVTLSNAEPLPQYVFSGVLNSFGLDTTVICRLGAETTYALSITNVVPAANGPVNFSFNVPFKVNTSTLLHGQLTVQNLMGTNTIGELTVNSISFELVMNRKIGSFYGVYEGGANVLWLDINDDGHLDLASQGQGLAAASTATISFNPAMTFPGYTTGGQNQWFDEYNLHESGQDGVILAGDFNQDNVMDALWIGTFNSSSTMLSTAEFPCITYGVSGTNGGSLARIFQYVNLPSITIHPDRPRGVVADFDHSGGQKILISSGDRDLNKGNPGYNLLLRNTGLTNQNGRLIANWQAYNTRAFLNPETDQDIVVPINGGWCIAGGFMSTNGFMDLYTFDWGTGLNTIYHNDGELGFDTVTNWGGADFLNYSGANAVWADFNGDGLDDLLIANNRGELGLNTFAIALNDGKGGFTNSNWALPQVYRKTSLAVGDIFNHGRNDILISGYGTTGVTNSWLPVEVLRNDGNGVFTPVTFGVNNVFTIGAQGVALGDYDGDGRLDIAVTSSSGMDMILASTDYPAVYRNELSIPSNAPPIAPTGLRSTVSAGRVDLAWSDASDDVTPVIDLTYNLRIGTTPLGVDICSPMSNLTNGWRKIADRGNLGHCLGTYYHLPPGTYYWSVQAIDGAFAGGAWAAEQTFTITAADQPELSFYGDTTNNLLWPSRFTGYQLEQTTNLLSGVWTTNSNQVLDSFNGKWLVTVSNPPASSMFYRLRK